MSELHVIGQISGASEFPNHRLYCKWSVHVGVTEGVTFVDFPMDKSQAVWMHPIDIHFATSSLKGWPRFQLDVWHQDWRGRDAPYAYGCIHIPSVPGNHKMICPTWRPLGTRSQQIKLFLNGGGMELKNPNMVHASPELYKLRTESMGNVHIDLNIITKNFEKFGIDY